VFQDEHKIAMLYNFDNRWRMIWTDGRPLPKVVDGGVEIDGEYREARWMGYSVGRWIDDYTLEVVTVGTMPEDRVWLDNTGPANQRQGADHRTIPPARQRHAGMVRDDRRSENLHAPVGHVEAAHDAAGLANRSDDTLLFAG
jgi:hypothetical protein